MNGFIGFVKDSFLKQRPCPHVFTTNIIEGLNRQFRKITKNKPSLTKDDSLRKILYLASKNIVEHWTACCRNWDQIISQLDILFDVNLINLTSF